MEEEIEIIVQPIKKIVIFECTQLPNEEFFKRVDARANLNVICGVWCGGLGLNFGLNSRNLGPDTRFHER